MNALSKGAVKLALGMMDGFVVLFIFMLALYVWSVADSTLWAVVTFVGLNTAWAFGRGAVEKLIKKNRVE